jgi:DHA1 family multidrug resistance protein-like MFS transporter
MNIFSLYVYEELHATELEVGLVFMIGGLASALLMMPVGYVADKVGKKKVVVAGCYMLSFAELLFAFTRSWIEVIPVLFLFNTAFSYRPVMSALVADSVVRRKRATGFAAFETLPGITVIFASGLGGFLAEPEVWGFQPLFMLAAILSFIMAVMRHATLREPESMSEKSSTAFKSPIEGLTYIRRAPGSLKALFVMTCIGPFFWAMIYPQFYALYAREILHLSRTQIGLAFAISGASRSFLLVPGGKLADHYGRKKFIVVSVITGPLLLIFYLFAPNVLAVYLISAVNGSIEGLSAPSWQTIEADLIPRGKRGTMMGLFAATRSITSTPSPVISGYLWQSYEPKTPFYLVACSSAIDLVLLLFIKETLTSKEE